MTAQPTIVPVPSSRLSRRKALLLGGSIAGALLLAGRASEAGAQAFAANPTTVTGAVGYNRVNPGVETISVESPTAIINWTPLSSVDNPIIFLPAGNVATFQNGPNNPDFAVLNRIVATVPVRFDGRVVSQLRDLSNNVAPGGTVIFSSPGGILIGSTAVFDVGNLVLTSLGVLDDGAGNFIDASGTLRFDAGDTFPTAAVITEPGSQINAPLQGSYVAMVAPRVEHGGSLLVNGAAAYIAAEQVEMRVNDGLFDIIVTAGTDNATPLIHTGATGGPASTGVGDTHRIYMVAVAKNQAITAMLEGNVGFEAASDATIENGAIVLSAGFDVVAGEVNPFPLSDQPASFRIVGGTVTSDLIGYARTDMFASGASTGTLTFDQDVSLHGGARARLFAGEGELVAVAGDAIVSSARSPVPGAFSAFAPGEIDLTGGEASIFAIDGGSLSIQGDALVDASAQGLFSEMGEAGSGTGGPARVFANRGSVLIEGDLRVLATGGGAVDGPIPDAGADGTGGLAAVEAQAQGSIRVGGTLDMDATGRGSRATGAGGGSGGDGVGGTTDVTAQSDGEVRIAGVTHVDAWGIGGRADAGAGGQGQGGDISITADGGAIEFSGRVDASAYAEGGAALGTGTGGDGRGGGATVTIRNSGTLGVAGRLNLNTFANGGSGSTAGAADGGRASIIAETGGSAAFADAVLDAGGTGGSSATGTGGEGRGGTALMSAVGATIMVAADRTVTLLAEGFGGTGHIGGVGRGGLSRVTAQDGEIDVAGTLAAVAPGFGGDSTQGTGGTGGAAFGGSAVIEALSGAAPSRISANDYSMNAFAFGGDGRISGASGGRAQGGSVRLVADAGNGTVTGGSARVDASGFGGDGGNGQAGADGAAGGEGVGGQAIVGTAAGPGAAGLTGSAAIDELTAAAEGYGGRGGTGGSGATTGGAGGEARGGLVRVQAIGGTAGFGEARLSSDAFAGSPGEAGDGAPERRGAGKAGFGGVTSLLSDAHPDSGQPGLIRFDTLSASASAAATAFSSPESRRAGAIDLRALGGAGITGGTMRFAATGSGSAGAPPESVVLLEDGGSITASATIGFNLDGSFRLTGAAGTVLRGDATAVDTRGTAFLDGRTLGREITIVSADIDLIGSIGDESTQRVELVAAPTGRQTVLGGTGEGPGYTLTDTEADRIRSGALRISAPAAGADPARAPDLLVHDLSLAGGGAAAGIGALELGTTGILRVEGALLIASAGSGDRVSIAADQRLEVLTPGGSIRVRDAAGLPAGTLSLTSNNIWSASQTILDQLRADPNFAGRDEALLNNSGAVEPRGYIEAGDVSLFARDTVFVHNSGTADDFAGITVLENTLTITPAGNQPLTIYAFGRRINPDGSFVTGEAFFREVQLAPGPAGYSDPSELNRCVINTGICPSDAPPPGGTPGGIPGNPDIIEGPVGGSAAILLPSAGEDDDLIDTSFASDPLIEEPVTSGGESILWDCDRDNDGDCDDEDR